MANCAGGMTRAEAERRMGPPASPDRPSFARPHAKAKPTPTTVMESFAALPHELHALMASFVGTDGAAGDMLRKLAGDAQDWTIQEAAGERSVRLNGRLQSRRDEPAIIRADGTREWWRDGKLHRDNDQPAVICASSTRMWFRDGKRHRDNDQPAAVYESGTQEWFCDGKRHRDNDLPAVIGADGTQEWWRDGKRHRDNDQPAVVWATTGTREWWSDGIRLCTSFAQ